MWTPALKAQMVTTLMIIVRCALNKSLDSVHANIRVVRLGKHGDWSDIYPQPQFGPPNKIKYTTCKQNLEQLVAFKRKTNCSMCRVQFHTQPETFTFYIYILSEHSRWSISKLQYLQFLFLRIRLRNVMGVKKTRAQTCSIIGILRKPIFSSQGISLKKHCQYRSFGISCINCLELMTNSWDIETRISAMLYQLWWW